MTAVARSWAPNFEHGWWWPLSSLTIVPTVVLFFFSINFITTSIEFWFNVPVEQALENSLRVGSRLYDRVEREQSVFS